MGYKRSLRVRKSRVRKSLKQHRRPRQSKRSRHTLRKNRRMRGGT